MHIHLQCVGGQWAAGCAGFTGLGLPGLQHGFAADHLAALAYQQVQQRPFTRREVNGFAAQPGPGQRGVEAEGAACLHRRCIAGEWRVHGGLPGRDGGRCKSGQAGATQHGLQACHQFTGVEGFGQVVVCAGIQAFYPAVHAVARGKDQHGHGRMLLAQAAQHGQAIHLGQPQVQHHTVEQ